MSDESNKTHEIIMELVRRALMASGASSGRYYVLRIDEKEASIEEVINGKPVPKGYRKFTNGRS